MPVIGIDWDAYYPFFFTYDKADVFVEVTEEEYTWIRRTEKRLIEVQKFLEAKRDEYYKRENK